jgi:hypothetical protein
MLKYAASERVMKSKAKVLEKFITQCSLTFKAYDHEVIISKSKSNLWHFTTNYNNKQFMIYCAPNLTKVKSIIKIALKKVPNNSRLVVVCSTHTKEEKQNAEELNYCLLDITTLQRYGNDMLEAKTRLSVASAA